jgi:cell division septum initiation protein DivIVA
MNAPFTIQQLIDASACSGQVARFKVTFPSGTVNVTVAKARKVAALFDWSFGIRFLDAEGRAEYARQNAPIWAEYERQNAAIRAEYERQNAAMWAEYDRQRAPIRAEYQRQNAAIWAEYDRQRAPIRAEYQRQNAAIWATAYIAT